MVTSYPCRHGIEYPPFPPLQQPTVIHVDEKVLVVEALNLILHKLNNSRAQWHLPQPSPVAPHLPLLISLRPIHPICTLAGNDIQGTWPEDIPLDEQPVVIVTGDGRIQHVELRRIGEECLPESCHEERRAIGSIHNAVNEHIRPHVANVGKDHVSGARDVLPVHDNTFVHQVAETTLAGDDEHLIWVDI
uniref:Uncharacterized protein n=1 Tax=Triticum urartu TaxID=4572 RepID=A0A8R7U616_TRIUA